MRFCINLVHRRVITAEQFVSAMEEFLRARKPLGRLAMESGLITMKQVFHILERQMETQQKFGQIAIELGYLTESQLSRLLAQQSKNGPSIGEILSAKGVISQEQMDLELQRFLQDQAENSEPQEACICGIGCKFHHLFKQAEEREVPAGSV